MRRLGIAAVLLLCVTAVGAQPVPQGDDFQVNTLTAGFQDGVDVGVEGDNDFLVIWQSLVSAGTDTDGFSIQGQSYTADGTPNGPEFQVNTYTTGDQLWASVAVAPSGSFVVVWMSSQAAGDSEEWSIQGQRFNAAGSPEGSQFQVNTFTVNSQEWPDVATDPDGDFVVVWHSFFDTTGDDADGWSIQGQRFAADGQPQGGQFQVNSFTNYNQIYAGVSMNSSGDFVVVWQSYHSAGADTHGNSTLGQRFAADGSPQGGEFQVNSYTTGDQSLPDVAMNSNGDFVVVWQDDDYFGSGSGIDGGGPGIVARRYSAGGVPVGGQFVVNTYTTDAQTYASVAFDSTDRFVVTWTSYGSFGSDNSDESIQGRQYEANGMPIGPEFQVNSHTPETQYNPAVAFGSEGRFVVSWAGYSSPGDDDDLTSAQARRLLAEIPIFVDGFESGDMSAWSNHVP